MVRILVGCVFASLAMAQTDPIADAVRAVREARNRGHFAEAAAAREAARKLLEQMPATADNYGRWVGSVAALYSSAGRTAEARAVVSRAFDLDPRDRELLLFAGSGDFPAVSLMAQLGLSHSPARKAVLQGPDPRKRELLSAAASSWENATAFVLEEVPQGLDPAEATIRKAREALKAGRTDDAFVLALRALDEAAPANETLFSEMPVFASMLALKQARGMADQLWERLFAMAEARAVDTLLPLLHVTREHARFLAEWPDRAPSARAAIVRYRDLLITAHGPGNGELATVLRMTIEFEQDHGAPQAAAAAAEELLALSAAIHGPDGTGNLTAIQTIAGLYEMQGNLPRVRALYQRAIGIADAGCAPDDFRRPGVRMQAAFALGHLGLFSEAEWLAREAVDLDPDFEDDLEQVLELRTVGQGSSPTRDVQVPLHEPGELPEVGSQLTIVPQFHRRGRG
jgi:tetratricopeptide (TPR) repeat protein